MKTTFYTFLILIAATGSLSYGAAAPAFNMRNLHNALDHAEAGPILSTDPTDNLVIVEKKALAEFAKREPINIVARWKKPDAKNPDGNILFYSKKFNGYLFDQDGRIDRLKNFYHLGPIRHFNKKGVRSHGRIRCAINAQACFETTIRLVRKEYFDLSDDDDTDTE